MGWSVIFDSWVLWPLLGQLFGQDLVAVTTVCSPCFGLKLKGNMIFLQLYLTGAVYSLDGSDSLKETMQASISATNKVTAKWTDRTERVN